jgi:8-oxo-dGTP diphosphatase
VNAPAPDEQPSIAAAIIVHDGKVLLVKRRISEGSLSWQFPAGAIEAGETPEQAAARETKEETGLTVIGTKVLGKRTHPNTGRTMIYVACDLSEGQARITDTDELTESVWADRNSLSIYVPYGFYPAVQEHLDATLN